MTDEQYRMLSGDYTDEQRMLEGTDSAEEQRLAQLQAREANVDSFIEKAKQYTTIDTLTPELLRLFIQRIEVGERETKYSHNSSQSIRIIYRDIGTWTAPCSQTRNSQAARRSVRSFYSQHKEAKGMRSGQFRFLAGVTVLCPCKGK